MKGKPIRLTKENSIENGRIRLIEAIDRWSTKKGISKAVLDTIATLRDWPNCGYIDREAIGVIIMVLYQTGQTRDRDMVNFLVNIKDPYPN